MCRDMIELDPKQMLQSDCDWQVALNRLHLINARICLVVTGGGSGAIGKCFGRPGASKHLIEAVVPYSRLSAIDYLGRDPEIPSVCETMAAEFAVVAKRRAERLADDGVGVPLGIALTAALPTKPPRNQQEAIFVARCLKDETQLWSAKLPQGHFDRAAGEQIAEAMIWEALVSGGNESQRP